MPERRGALLDPQESPSARHIAEHLHRRRGKGMCMARELALRDDDPRADMGDGFRFFGDSVDCAEQYIALAVLPVHRRSPSGTGSSAAASTSFKEARISQ